jgi:hypothetical protein
MSWLMGKCEFDSPINEMVFLINELLEKPVLKITGISALVIKELEKIVNLEFE